MFCGEMILSSLDVLLTTIDISYQIWINSKHINRATADKLKKIVGGLRDGGKISD